jgi:ABC-type uncharacterized transport system permease subunit
MEWSLLLLRAALVFYCLGFLNAFVPLLGGGRRLSGLTPWLAAAGALAHTGALVTLGIELRRCPLSTLPEVLSALAWAAVLIDLVAFWRLRLDVLHVVILPLVLIVLFISKLLPEPLVPLSAGLAPAVLRFHLMVIVLAVAALFITFAASLVYLVIDRALKRKRLSPPSLRLPSLDRCDGVGRTSLLWAYPLLTLGIVTGAVVSASLDGSPWTWQPRETLAILAWAILGVVVVARLGWGWRGRNAALLTLFGIVVLMIRMLGVT